MADILEIQNGELMNIVREQKLNPLITQHNHMQFVLSDLVATLSSAEDMINELKTQTTRQKSQVDYLNKNIVLTDGTKYNLLTLMGDQTPTSGALAPYFDIINNKLIAFVNDNRTMHVKLVIQGFFDGSPSLSTGALQFSFEGPVSQQYILARDNLSSSEVFNIETFFSVDKNGTIVTDGGINVFVTAKGHNFNITSIRAVAEQ